MFMIGKDIAAPKFAMYLRLVEMSTFCLPSSDEVGPYAGRDLRICLT
jgi:hypothetical protein